MGGFFSVVVELNYCNNSKRKRKNLEKEKGGGEIERDARASQIERGTLNFPSFKPTLFVPFRRTQNFHHNKARAT
jgi:hypothetical protein